MFKWPEPTLRHSSNKRVKYGPSVDDERRKLHAREVITRIAMVFPGTQGVSGVGPGTTCFVVNNNGIGKKKPGG